jgi:hypothetical protein
MLVSVENVAAPVQNLVPHFLSRPAHVDDLPRLCPTAIWSEGLAYVNLFPPPIWQLLDDIWPLTHPSVPARVIEPSRGDGSLGHSGLAYLTQSKVMNGG